MPTVLVTGANRGLGLHFAQQYAAEGWRVLATCRRPDEAEALRELPVEVHRLDVTDQQQVDALAEALAGQPIDLLIHNAGVGEAGGLGSGGVDVEGWVHTLRTNTIAPLVLTRALVENVAASERKTVVAISSGLGSIADNASGGMYAYRSSKAAVNMVMRSLAVELRPRGIVVVPIEPGWASTDMGGPSAPQLPADSVRDMRAVIERLGLRDSGRFFSYSGSEFPW